MIDASKSIPKWNIHILEFDAYENPYSLLIKSLKSIHRVWILNHNIEPNRCALEAYYALENLVSSMQVPRKFPSRSIQVPCQFHASSKQVPHKFRASSLQFPFNFEAQCMYVPYRLDASSTQVPRKFYASSSQVPSKFQVSCLPVPFKLLAGCGNFHANSSAMQVRRKFHGRVEQACQFALTFFAKFMQVPCKFDDSSI